MQTKLIKFQKTELIAVQDADDNIFVAIKPICEAIGLNHDSACAGIKKDEILGAAHGIHNVQVSENQSKNYLTLPIHLINGWLFSLSINKVNPAAREKLMLYRKECYKVLFNHFFGYKKQIAHRDKRRLAIQNEIDSVNKSIYNLQQKRSNLKKECHKLDKEVYEQLSMFYNFSELNYANDSM